MKQITHKSCPVEFHIRPHRWILRTFLWAWWQVFPVVIDLHFISSAHSGGFLWWVDSNCIPLVSVATGLPTKPLPLPVLRQSFTWHWFFNGPTPASFSFISSFSNTHITILTTDYCEKMSIQYPVPGFEPTTLTARPGLPPNLGDIVSLSTLSTKIGVDVLGTLTTL